MGSLSKQPNLPTIDFTKVTLNPSSNSWSSTCIEVQHALEEYGFFMAIYDGVSPHHKDTIFQALKDLFDLPSERKVLNTSHRPYYGYFGQSTSVPLHESMGMGDATTLEGIQSFSSTMWPSGNDHFCETMHSYANQVSKLEQMVIRMVFESYGVERHYGHHIDSTTYLLRVMKYRLPKVDETNIGAHAHTDKSFITILHQNQANGLEIKLKDGQWVGVDFPPSSCVVLAGDAFLAWSNGRIHPPLHKVVINGNEERYSLGLFSYNNGTVEIPEELIDQKHPRKFKSFDHFGILDFFVKDLGRQGQSTAMAYCGV